MVQITRQLIVGLLEADGDEQAKSRPDSKLLEAVSQRKEFIAAYGADASYEIVKRQPLHEIARAEALELLRRDGPPMGSYNDLALLDSYPNSHLAFKVLVSQSRMGTYPAREGGQLTVV